MPPPSGQHLSVRGGRVATPRTEALPGQDKGNLVGEGALRLYAAAGRLAFPLAGVLLARREKRGKEDPGRRGERFGRASCVRPAGPVIWVHAASVGETAAALPLVERLVEGGAAVVMTTGTVTAAHVAAQRLPAAALHQFVPIDTPAAMGRFLDHWRPGLALFAESELWPTALSELNRRTVPLILVNGRMSDRSFRRWRALAPIARAIMCRLELCLAQTPTDAARLRTLGARRVAVSGNLKFDAPPPPANASLVARMRRDIGDRFVLVAASTHPGEEAPVIAAHRQIAGSGAKFLTILAPRHPQRGDALAAEIAGAGLSVRRRSRGDAIDAATDIYLADTIGEMGLWYRLADVAFLGGSISPRGGQNPIEPAKLHVPVLHGKHVSNFRGVYQALAAANAVTMIEDGASLPSVVERLMSDDEERQRLARDAYVCVKRLTGALDRTVEALEPYLAALRHDHAAAAGA